MVVSVCVHVRCGQCVCMCAWVGGRVGGVGGGDGGEGGWGEREAKPRTSLHTLRYTVATASRANMPGRSSCFVAFAPPEESHPRPHAHRAECQPVLGSPVQPSPARPREKTRRGRRAPHPAPGGRALNPHRTCARVRRDARTPHSSGTRTASARGTHPLQRRRPWARPRPWRPPLPWPQCPPPSPSRRPPPPGRSAGPRPAGPAHAR
jgi:hypothetical protein